MELTIENLSKSYGDTLALDNLSITFKPGVYGLLGPNGAGKSTLINLITDNLKRDKNSGSVLYNGTDIIDLSQEFRKLVGYVPQQQGMYEQMSARNFLNYMGQIKGIPKKELKLQVCHLLEKVGLKSVEYKKIGSFSGGMKQRVMLAQALLGEPEIIILDEPTVGLDPSERINFRNFIEELSNNKIVLYATHVVSDIESIADYILLMNKGQLVNFGTPKELIYGIRGKVAQIICTKEELQELNQRFIIGSITQRETGVLVRMIQAKDHLDSVFSENASILQEDLSLEDVYLYWLGDVKIGQLL